jgi:FixJ family two-component response regulator
MSHSAYEPAVSPVTLVVTADPVLGGCLAWLLRAGGLEAEHSDLPVELLEPEAAVTGVVVDGRLLEHSPGHVLARLATTFPDAVVVAMAGRPDHPGLRAAVERGAVPLTADFELSALVRALGGDALGGGESDVREPRRPYPPTFPGVLALRLPGSP